MTPRPANRKPATVSLALALATALSGSGCATTGAERQSPFDPVVLTSAASAVRVTAHGDLLDRLSGVSEADDQGWLELFLYGPPERPDRYLRNPQGLAVRGDALFVCDQGLPDVVKIDLTTGKLTRWAAFDDRPSAPLDVTIDENGGVYVADVTEGAVLAYDDGGRLLRKLSPTTDPAVDFRPTSVLVSDGILYVGDRAARRIHRFDLARNEWLSAWRPAEGGVALVAPTGLAMTPDHTLLVADAISGVVHRVDRQGKWLTPIGRRGRETGGFVRPMHVCCTTSGAILVTDAAKQTVSIFDPAGELLTEVSTRSNNRTGWTLPGGVVSVPRAAVMTALRGKPGDATPNPADSAAWFLISDTLGADSLTLLSVTPVPLGGSP